MRLIDANSLREQIDDYKYFHSSFQKMTVAEFLTIVHDLIGNAPTVFSCNACKNMGNERECVDCHDYSNYVHYEERPQGKWEKCQNDMFRCSNCGQADEVPTAMGTPIYKFCPNCGADMRGEEE